MVKQHLRNASSWFCFLHTFGFDTCRLTLTEWAHLWETTKGWEPVSVDVCDWICLSSCLCSDKSTDVCQIDRACLSIKTVGALVFESLLELTKFWSFLVYSNLRSQTFGKLKRSQTFHVYHRYSEYRLNKNINEQKKCCFCFTTLLVQNSPKIPEIMILYF